MAETVWTRRNIAALAAIVIIAAGIIIAAGLLVSKPATRDTTGSSTTDLRPLLLDMSAVSAIMNGLNLKESSRDQQLGVPGAGYSISPAECTQVDFVGNAVAYADTGWTGARAQGFTEVGGDSQSMYELIVAMPADRGRELIDSSARAWLECGGKTYTTNSKGTNSNWFVQEIAQNGEQLIATVKYSDSEWFCERALGTKSGYVAEARVCGRVRGKAQAIAEKILQNANT